MTIGIGTSHTAITAGITRSATEGGIIIHHGTVHGITTAGIARGTTAAGTAHGIMTVSGIIHGTTTAGITEDGTTHTTAAGMEDGILTGITTGQVSLHTVLDI